MGTLERMRKSMKSPWTKTGLANMSRKDQKMEISRNRRGTSAKGRSEGS